MKGSQDQVLQCTTGQFDGAIAILDPERSWVVSQPHTTSSFILQAVLISWVCLICAGKVATEQQTLARCVRRQGSGSTPSGYHRRPRSTWDKGEPKQRISFNALLASDADGRGVYRFTRARWTTEFDLRKAGWRGWDAGRRLGRAGSCCTIVVFAA